MGMCSQCNSFAIFEVLPIFDEATKLNYDYRMKKIVTIGGGEIDEKETLVIDKEIIRLSGKKHPKLLFIPTASGDAQGYWEGIQKYFGKQLGCKTDVLLLANGKLSRAEIESKILNTDIIYVGGGNTLKMMKRWRLLGVDKVLKKAWERGIILSGLSAGSICWYESGHSDSMSFYDDEKWIYTNVTGLGVLKGIHCPHFDSETLGVKRRKNFEDMIRKIGGFGIGVDDGCAIEFVGNTYRVITSKPHAKAYKVYNRNGDIVTEEIEQKKEFTNISELYKKSGI